ncbi:MAG: hypothetical protein MJ078_05005, partial [Clostridia bacterium]|nr:hypothetical protein [Clostridia bacterium]
MFYGLPSSRAASLDENERKRYTPWEGGQFGGSLCFSAGGRGYRIERLFGAKEKDDRLTVYRLDTGMPYGDFGTSPGEALFGVNAEGFAKSLFISRISGEDNLNEPSIRAGLGAFADTAADLGDFDEAEKKLTGEIKALQTTGERGELPELSRKIAEKEKEIARRLAALKEAEEKRVRLAGLAKEKEELLRQLQNATERSKLIAKESADREHFAVAKSMEKVYLRQKEEGRTLSSAFVRGGVTEEEMSAAEEKTEVYLQAAAAFRGEEDRKPDERTRTLKEKYQTAENAARLAASFGKDCRAWRDAESQKAVLAAALPEEKKWDRTPPTREQIEKAKRYAQSPASGRKSPLPAVLALCGGLCVLAGALLYFFLPPALPGAEYVAWGCGAALLLCGVLLLGKGGKTAEEKEIVSLLSCFGYAKKPYASSAMRFVMDGEAYLKAREEREALQKRLDGVREEAESLRQSLSAVSQKYGLPDDPDAGEKELSLQAAFLAEAEREEKEIGEKLVLLREKLDCCREDAKAFLSTLFTCGPEDSPDEVLRMMKDRRTAARNAAEKEAEAEKEWKRYLAAYRIDPGKEPVYTAEEELSVRQEEQDAQTRMYRNMQEEGALKAETEALEDEAGLLSENQEEKNALLRRKEELTQKLAWLTGARTYLEQAKENLSS